MANLWEVFPFPTISMGEITNGALMDAHPACVRCRARPCVEDSQQREPAEIAHCRYGISYSRVDDVRNIIGLTVGLPEQSAAARRAYSRDKQRRATPGQVRSAVQAAQRLGTGLVESFETSRQELLAALAADPEMLKSLAEQLRHEFDENLEQSHDFLQLLTQVQGNAEAILLDKHPGMDVDLAAEKSPHEGAIFFAAKLMKVKIDSLVYLQEINRVHGGETRFQIHPFILKYVRIYKWQAEQRELRIRLDGSSYAAVFLSGDAVGAVVQALLDNMVKYAPAGSNATVEFAESGDRVAVSFRSIGPRIEKEEMSKIFLPRYRAVSARRIESLGQGIGLATAKSISDVLGLQLSVEQDADPHPSYSGRFSTTFSLSFTKAV